MKIFIRRIPSSASPPDVVSFLERLTQPHWYMPWRTDGQITDCKILKIQDPQEDSIEFHALAQVEPDAAALQVLSRLNGRKLKGRIVEVRRWHERSAASEQRVSTTSPPANEQRLSERRRQALSIEHLG